LGKKSLDAEASSSTAARSLQKPAARSVQRRAPRLPSPQPPIEDKGPTYFARIPSKPGFLPEPDLDAVLPRDERATSLLSIQATFWLSKPYTAMTIRLCVLEFS
jgi:hypothetical protein